MARAKRVNDEADEPTRLGRADIDDSGQDFDLFDAINQLPSETKAIQIWRMHEQGRPRYLGLLAPFEFNVEHVKATWGGGKYRIAFPLDGGRIERVIEIEGEPITPDRKDAPNYWGINRDRVTNVPLPANADPMMLALLNEIRELKLSMRGGGSNDAITQALIQALLTKDKGEDRVLEQMLRYKALFAPSQGTADANTILGALKTGLELSGGEGISATSTSPWLSLAEKVLPMIAAAFNRAAQPQPQADGAVPPGYIMTERGLILANPDDPTNFIQNSTNRNGALPMQPKTGFQAIAENLSPYLPALIGAASQNKDPAPIVEGAINLLNPEAVKVMVEWLNTERWFSDLCTLSPLIAGQQAWWIEFRDALVDIVTNPPIEGPEQES